jgi:hydrogenase maturation protein HypF
MAAGILSKGADVEKWLLQNRQHFPHGEKEIQVVLSQLEKGQGIIETTSCGRVLDAVAVILGICHERTYEGEPAMKLESAALRGKNVLKLKPIIKNNSLDTTQMLVEIFENREKHSMVDLAYSAHAYLAEGLVALAIEKALENKVKNIGFSGGAACNQILALVMRKTVEAAGLRFLVHEAVPPGDGGLSFGQAVAGGFFQL